MDLQNSAVVLGAVSVVVFVVGVLLGRLSAGRGWTLAELRSIVEMLVQEAEQTMTKEPGEERLSWVLQRADELGITRYLPAPLLSAMIESAVWLLNNGGSVQNKIEFDGRPLWRDRSN